MLVRFLYSSFVLNCRNPDAYFKLTVHLSLDQKNLSQSAQQLYVASGYSTGQCSAVSFPSDGHALNACQI